MEKRVTKESWKRVVLWFALFVSVAFNYMLYQDNQYMTQRFKEVKHGIYENVIDPDLAYSIGE